MAVDFVKISNFVPAPLWVNAREATSMFVRRVVLEDMLPQIARRPTRDSTGLWPPQLQDPAPHLIGG